MSLATFICGIWSLFRIFRVILAGGVGKNGSTVAVSLKQVSHRDQHHFDDGPPTKLKKKQKKRTNNNNNFEANVPKCKTVPILTHSLFNSLYQCWL